MPRMSPDRYEEEYNERRGRDFDVPLMGECEWCGCPFLREDLTDGYCAECAAELTEGGSWE